MANEAIDVALTSLFDAVTTQFKCAAASEDAIQRYDELVLVEERLSALSQDISSKKTAGGRLHNEKTPIHRLPNSILTEVLLLLNDWPYWDLVEKHRLLASVCKRWFDLIIQEPRFWPLLNVRDVAAANTVIKRSKESLLTVRCRTWKKEEEATTFLEVACKASDRWESMFFRGDLSDPLKEYLEKPTPKMTGFYAVSEDSNRMVKIDLSEGCPLKVLDIDRVYMDWASPRLANIERLSLVRMNSNTAPTFDQFRKILAASPKLTMMVLRHWNEFPDESEPSIEVSDDDLIDLPSLRSLEIQYLPEKVSLWLLPRIKSPDFRSLAIDKTVPWRFVPLDMPSTVSNLIFNSLAKAPKPVVMYKTGGKACKFAVTPTLSMSRDWLDQKVDPPGAEVEVNLEGCPEGWWQNLGKVLEEKLGKNDSFTLRLECDSFLLKGADEKPKSNFMTELTPEFIGEHFGYTTGLSFAQYCDAGRYLRHFTTSRRADGSWLLPRLNTIDCHHLYTIRSIVPDLWLFAETRMRVAKEKEGDEAGQVTTLKSLVLDDDVVEVFREKDFLRDVECRTSPE